MEEDGFPSFRVKHKNLHNGRFHREPGHDDKKWDVSEVCFSRRLRGLSNLDWIRMPSLNTPETLRRTSKTLASIHGLIDMALAHGTKAEPPLPGIIDMYKSLSAEIWRVPASMSQIAAFDIITLVGEPMACRRMYVVVVVGMH